MSDAGDAAHDPVVIVSGARTPMGAFQGDFASLSAPQLGAIAIEAAVQRAGLKPEQIDEVLMGCVLPAGLGRRRHVRRRSAQVCRSRPAAPQSTRCAAPACARRCSRTTCWWRGRPA